MKKQRKNQKGITLIALVVTIIVLLILAGVSLSLVVGQNGVLNKATDSVSATKEGMAIEQVSLAWSACQTDYFTNNDNTKEKSSFFIKEKLNENLGQGEVIEVNFEKDENGSEVKYKLDGTIYTVIVSSDGIVKIAGTGNGEDTDTTSTGIFAKLYRYKDGREGEILELSSNPDYIDSEYELITDYNNIDINSLNMESEKFPWDASKETIVYSKIVDKIKYILNEGLFSDCNKLETIEGLGNLEATSLSHMFYYCTSLTSLDLSSFKTDNATDMCFMFSNCKSLTSLDLSNFKTDNVTDMSYMFSNCKSLTSLDLSSFKTDNVTDMRYMFEFCSSLMSLDLSSFKTENVVNMRSMFYYCSSLTSLDLSNFKTENVTDMGAMFDICENLTNLDLSNFKTDNVTNMRVMFECCASLTSLDLSSFKTDNVVNMEYMFNDCSSLEKVYVTMSQWVTAKDSAGMFRGCITKSVTDISEKTV